MPFADLLPELFNCQCTFIVVATPTGRKQVVNLILTATIQRNNMIRLHFLKLDFTTAISTMSGKFVPYMNPFLC